MRIVIALLYTVAALALGGCGATGTAFQGVENPTAGSARLYVYRPQQDIPVMAYPSVSVNQQTLGGLKNGGYLTASIAPGKNTITFAGNPINWVYRTQSLSFDAVEGRTYFFRLTVGVESTGTTFYAHDIEQPRALEQIRSLRESK